MQVSLTARSSFMISALLALCLGCSSTRQEQHAELPFTIILGSGGGFTGLYEGYVIDSTGRVMRWKGRTFDGAEHTRQAVLDDDQRKEVQRIVAETGILGAEFSERGNMTSFLTFHLPTGEHRISWHGGAPGPGVPANIREFYNRIREFLQKADNKPQ
jgi:hypothetical protein